MKKYQKETMLHQYIERESGKVLTERLYGNGVIKVLYSELREHAPAFFRALTRARASRLLGFMNYELFLGEKSVRAYEFPEIKWNRPEGMY